MKIRLIRAARIRHEAGETVDVSPADAAFLISTGSAIPEAETAPARETPEDKMDAPETAERKPAVRKTRKQ